MNTGIYAIVNLANGKRYIGSAVKLSWRERKHRLHLSRGTHHSLHLQRAWDKYGAQSFRFMPILYCDKGMLHFYEQKLLDGYKPEYNVCKDVRGPLGIKRTPEFCRKLGDRKRGVAVPEEVRKKISDSLKGREGRKFTPSQKEKISEIASRRAWGHGRAQMLALAEMKRGVPRSDEVKAKLSKSSAALSEEAVREIRSRVAAGEKQKDMIPIYGVSQQCVSEIVNRKSYRWVI